MLLVILFLVDLIKYGLILKDRITTINSGMLTSCSAETIKSTVLKFKEYRFYMDIY